MRILTAIAALLLLTSSASAQLLAVYFKDQKDANKFKNNLVLYKGDYVVVGEPYENVRFEAETNTIITVPDKARGFLVADSDDPLKVPYKFDGDNKVVTAKKQIISIPENQVERIALFMRDNSLAGLARDYESRKKELDALSAARDGKQKGSPQWMNAHQRMVSEMEKLLSWLETTCYPDAAKKLEKEIVKQQKVVAAEAIAARGIAAKASVKLIPTTPELVAVAQSVSSGQDAFKIQESLHCRIVYHSSIDDERIKAVLEFAEQAIESFRLDFVDPYVDAAYEDYIPERIFCEYFFGPDDIPRHEKYFTAYYHQSWGEHKDDRLKSEGNGAERSSPPELLHYWRLAPDLDIEGVVAHSLGHDLAQIHYDRNRLGMSQDWLQEGVGLYLALEWLGQNNVNCKAFAPPSEYARKNKSEGDKAKQLGLRDYFNALAIEKGPTIDKLALKGLFDMEDADMAKSWSFFDFIAKKCGKQGQLFLRACCNASRTKATFVKDWRAKAEEIFDVKGQDVFAVIDKRWKDFAEVGQDTGDTKRNR